MKTTYFVDNSTLLQAPSFVSTIVGDYDGFDYENLYEFIDGTMWLQTELYRKYDYAFRPTVAVYYMNAYYMNVEGIDRAVRVANVPYLRSYITSSFDGFSYGNVYVLANGQIWQQSEFRNWYHYAVHPDAVIYEYLGAYYLKVEGIDEAVRVIRNQ